MPGPLVLVFHWLPDGELARWRQQFPHCDFLDGPSNPGRLGDAAVLYGLPDLALLSRATSLRWLQLASAGVPGPLCPIAAARRLTVTNLAGLYGPTIAEHALAMLLFLSRNLSAVVHNQAQEKWDRSVAAALRDLHGLTLGIVGLGNIGQSIARLSRALGMRVVGCRRTGQPVAGVDRVYPPGEVRAMLREADHVAVAAPATAQTEGMLGKEELASVKARAIYINVSRGTIAQEKALLEALQSGHLAAAGLDVFAVEPLPASHPFWSMPNVLVSPHYSGETVNTSSLPAQRFARNLRSWLDGSPLEGVVCPEHGY
jgi:D-2-hydroxyacid dehydrogenase (NADP+)